MNLKKSSFLLSKKAFNPSINLMGVEYNERLGGEREVHI